MGLGLDYRLSFEFPILCKIVVNNVDLTADRVVAQWPGWWTKTDGCSVS